MARLQNTDIENKESFMLEVKECTKMFLFEIQNPIDDEDYFIFNIGFDFNLDKMNASTIDMDIEYDFSLDSNLEALYEECMNEVIERINK